jgi:hypothetical protein
MHAIVAAQIAAAPCLIQVVEILLDPGVNKTEGKLLVIVLLRTTVARMNPANTGSS